MTNSSFNNFYFEFVNLIFNIHYILKVLICELKHKLKLRLQD